MGWFKRIFGSQDSANWLQPTIDEVQDEKQAKENARRQERMRRNQIAGTFQQTYSKLITKRLQEFLDVMKRNNKNKLKVSVHSSDTRGFDRPDVELWWRVVWKLASTK